jgi:hypothetical protein
MSEVSEVREVGDGRESVGETGGDDDDRAIFTGTEFKSPSLSLLGVVFVCLDIIIID